MIVITCVSYQQEDPAIRIIETINFSQYLVGYTNQN